MVHMEKCCTVSCRRSMGLARKTTGTMFWRVASGTRWSCRRRSIYGNRRHVIWCRNQRTSSRRWNRRKGRHGARPGRQKYAAWSRTAFMSRWLSRRIRSWSARRCSISARLGRLGRGVRVSSYRSRILAGGRSTLDEEVLTHTRGRFDSDAFSDGSSQGRGASPFWCRAGILEGQRRWADFHLDPRKTPVFSSGGRTPE